MPMKTRADQRAVSNKNGMDRVEARLKDLLLSNKLLSDSHQSLSDTVASLVQGTSVQPPADTARLLLSSPSPQVSMSIGHQQATVMNVQTSLSASGIQEDKRRQRDQQQIVQDQLQSCMDAIRGLAGSLTSAMDAWTYHTGKAYHGVNSSLRRVLQEIGKLPPQLHSCAHCGAIDSSHGSGACPCLSEALKSLKIIFKPHDGAFKSGLGASLPGSFFDTDGRRSANPSPPRASPGLSRLPSIRRDDRRDSGRYIATRESSNSNRVDKEHVAREARIAGQWEPYEEVSLRRMKAIKAAENRQFDLEVERAVSRRRRSRRTPYYASRDSDRSPGSRHSSPPAPPRLPQPVYTGARFTSSSPGPMHTTSVRPGSNHRCATEYHYHDLGSREATTSRRAIRNRRREERERLRTADKWHRNDPAPSDGYGMGHFSLPNQKHTDRRDSSRHSSSIPLLHQTVRRLSRSIKYKRTTIIPRTTPTHHMTLSLLARTLRMAQNQVLIPLWHLQNSFGPWACSHKVVPCLRNKARARSTRCTREILTLPCTPRLVKGGGVAVATRAMRVQFMAATGSKYKSRRPRNLELWMLLLLRANFLLVG